MTYFLAPKVSNIGALMSSQRRQTSYSHTSATNPQSRRSVSVNDWVGFVLPSHRPERGGTTRERGYWEQQDLETPGKRRFRRNVTESYHSRPSETGDPDQLIRWNTAKDIPKNSSSGISNTRAAVPFEPDAAIDPNRKLSWMPRDDIRKQIAPKKCRPTDSGRSGDDEPLRDSVLEARAHQRLTNTRSIIEAQKSRQERRSLKRSGDFLGVQGINPQTGQLDVLTPTDSESTASLEITQRLSNIKHTLKKAKHAYKQAQIQSKRAALATMLEIEEEKARLRLERKESLSRKINRGLRWRRHTKQWSSAQEPALSPIAQSQRSKSPVSRK
jgi:hypothetical protein